jgi:hypothetical protein
LLKIEIKIKFAAKMKKKCAESAFAQKIGRGGGVSRGI